MPLNHYSKSTPRLTSTWTAISLLSIHRNKILLALSFVLIVTGVFLIVNAVWPIISFELFTSKEITDTQTPKTLVQTILAKSSTSQTPDLTNPDNWFPQYKPLDGRPSKIENYNISIPKLKIKDATVKIGGTNLKESLIQYKGTANPGQPGNPVIFGHSILPQFYNPKNYISIFSTIPTLKPKDPILINYDGIEYRYEVVEVKQVKPTEVSVLEQRYDRRELSLVTCCPPGTYLRRCVVKAQLVENAR